MQYFTSVQIINQQPYNTYQYFLLLSLWCLGGGSISGPIFATPKETTKTIGFVALILFGGISTDGAAPTGYAYDYGNLL